MKRWIAVLFLLCLLLSACGPARPTADVEPAEKTLREFFQALNDADYERAVELYGGDYDYLREINPQVDPANLAGLWQAGCEINGLVCLPVGNIVETRPLNSDEGVWIVQFLDENGQIFAMGPCCGAEENAVKQTDFEIRVLKKKGDFLVEDMPALLP